MIYPALAAINAMNNLHDQAGDMSHQMKLSFLSEVAERIDYEIRSLEDRIEEEE